MKALARIALISQVFASPLAPMAQAAGFICERPARAAEFIVNRATRGNFTFQNTNNWTYRAIPGDDVYQHNRLSQTIQTLCSRGGPGGWDFGIRKNDHNGYQDVCGRWTEAVSLSRVTPSCSSGFSLSADKRTCHRPATPRTFRPNRPPQGNWTIQDTSNFTYVAVPAPALDIYRQNGNPDRVVSTLCARTGAGGWNYGVRYNDYNGMQDMCGTWINAQPAMTVAASCPAGHALVYRP